MDIARPSEGFDFKDDELVSCREEVAFSRRWYKKVYLGIFIAAAVSSCAIQSSHRRTQERADTSKVLQEDDTEVAAEVEGKKKGQDMLQ